MAIDRLIHRQITNGMQVYNLIDQNGRPVWRIFCKPYKKLHLRALNYFCYFLLCRSPAWPLLFACVLSHVCASLSAILYKGVTHMSAGSCTHLAAPELLLRPPPGARDSRQEKTESWAALLPPCGESSSMSSPPPL